MQQPPCHKISPNRHLEVFGQMLRVHDARLLLQRGILLPAVSISKWNFPKHHRDFPGHPNHKWALTVGMGVTHNLGQDWDWLL